jgi:hypothetical protein
LFGYLEDKLRKLNTSDRESLNTVVTAISVENSKETLLAVFLAWRKRLKWVTKHMRHYDNK